MAGILDSQMLDLRCQACGEVVQKSIGWIKTHGAYTCACGTEVALDADRLKREITAIERRLAQLGRNLRKP